MARFLENNQQQTVDLHQQLNQIRESISDRTGCLTDLDSNKKRWLVTGIVLHSVLSPTLRDYVTDSLEQIYQTLKLNNSIDTQLHPTHLKSYLTTFLNYEAINGNRALGLRQQSQFNYKVNDAVDFSKLFLKTHMAHYSAFDESCDSSALLEIIFGSCPTSGQLCAKKVKEEVRNPWAHCDFTVWDDNKYKACMKLIKELIESLGLQNQVEIITLLQKWNQNGEKFINGTSPEFVVLGEIQTQVQALLCCIESIASDTPDLISKLKEELNIAVSALMKRVQALEKANQEIIAYVKSLKERIDKKEDTIPKHMKEKYQIYINEWEKDEEKFIVTRATEHVTGLMEDNNVVVVTGSSGSGKSSLIHHIALKFKKQGYTIIPFVYGPDDIIRYRDMKKKQLFIIDNLCGKNYIDETDLQIWKNHTNKIEKLFPNEPSKEQGTLKFLVSCRLQIYKDVNFKSLEIFTETAVDLQSKNCCLRSEEKHKMLNKYIRNTIPYYRWQNINEKLKNCHFFPLLCKIARGKNVEQLTDLFSSPFNSMRKDIRDMIRTKPMANCALVLCVLFPDGFDEDFIDPRTRPQQVEQKIIDIIDTYEINLANERNRAQLRDAFEQLDGTYVTKTGPLYFISHDKLYDMVAVEGCYQVTELFLKYASSTLIAEQFRFTSVFLKEENQLLVYLNDNEEKLYLERCFKDLHRKSYKSFFNNKQLKDEKYKTKVMEYIYRNRESCDELFRRLDREGLTEDSDNTYNYTTTPVIEATKTGFYQMIEYLTDIQCDLNKQDSDCNSPLWYSCVHGFNYIINHLLNHNVKYVNDLVRACRHYKTGAVRVMVESGLVDLSQCSIMYEQTPLTAACREGHMEIAKLLLGHNAEYNIDDLVMACRFNMTDVVRVMVERGMMDLSQYSSMYEQTPLTAACRRGHREIAKLLLSHNAEYNIDDLVMACSFNMTDVVRVMVERGMMDLSQYSSMYEQTPLTAACRGGHGEIVKLLLSHNAKYNIDDLVMACRFNMTDAVRVMVEKGMVDLSQYSSMYKQTPLTAACRGGHGEIVKLLLSHNVQYDIEDLVMSCGHGLTNAVRVMVEKGMVDLSQYSSMHKQTPLTAACRGGHGEIAHLLLTHNVNYDVFSLVSACSHGMTDVVRVMVEKGLVDLSLCESEKGNTPLNAACSRGHSEIVHLLLTHNAKYDMDDFVMACKLGMTDAVRVMVERGLVDLTQCSIRYEKIFTCSKGHSEIFHLLLSHKAKYNVDDLVMACRLGMTDAVRVMIERGLVDMAQCSSIYEQTPLTAACERGHTGIINLLLSHNIKYDIDDLVMACRYGMIDVVRIIVESGMVDLSQCCMNEQTPLTAACSRCHSEIASLLLSLNVKYNVDDLVVACRFGMTDAVRVMIERGLVDMAQRSSIYEQTPLTAACRGGHSEIASLLLGFNVNYNVDDLVVACDRGIIDIVRVMIERGLVDPSQCSSIYEKTPLTAACNRCHSEIANLLLSHNVECNVDDLVLACDRGMTDTVRVMVERGLVDLTQCFWLTGRTPLTAACELGQTQIVEMLLKGGADPSQTDSSGKTGLDYTDNETIINLFKIHMKHDINST